MGNLEYLNKKPKTRQHEYDKTIMSQYSYSYKELRLYLQMQMIWALAEILLLNVFFHGKMETSPCEAERRPSEGLSC